MKLPVALDKIFPSDIVWPYSGVLTSNDNILYRQVLISSNTN